MRSKHLALSTGLAVLALAASMIVPAGAAGKDHEAAIKACTAINSNQPASLVTAIDDGRGGSLVWLADADLNLWLCNADAEGKVYANSIMSGDLFEGKGASIVNVEPTVGDGGLPAQEHDPLAVAEQVCAAYLAGEPGKVIGSGPDGLKGDWIPGYFVFVANQKGDIHLCDATGQAEIWAFAPIGAPLAAVPVA